MNAYTWCKPPRELPSEAESEMEAAATDVVRAMLGAPTYRRPHPITMGPPHWRYLDGGQVRVVVHWWGRKDVARTWAATYETPREAFYGWCRVMGDEIGQRASFRAFYMLGRVGPR